MIYIYNTGMYYGVQADSQPSVFDVSTLVATYSENNWFENQGILREVNGALVLGPLSPEAAAVNARIEELKLAISQHEEHLRGYDYAVTELAFGDITQAEFDAVKPQRASCKAQKKAAEDELATLMPVDAGMTVMVVWVDPKGNPTNPPVEPK